MSDKTIQDRQLDELIKLRKMVETMKKDIDAETNKPFWKIGLQEFATGILKGIGLVIGTTIVAAIIIYVLQMLVDWSQLQINIIDWISNTLSSGLGNTLPNISSFLR